MTRPRIEPQSPWTMMNTLPTRIGNRISAPNSNPGRGSMQENNLLSNELCCSGRRKSDYKAKTKYIFEFCQRAEEVMEHEDDNYFKHRWGPGNLKKGWNYRWSEKELRLSRLKHWWDQLRYLVDLWGTEETFCHSNFSENQFKLVR